MAPSVGARFHDRGFGPCPSHSPAASHGATLRGRLDGFAMARAIAIDTVARRSETFHPGGRQALLENVGKPDQEPPP